MEIAFVNLNAKSIVGVDRTSSTFEELDFEDIFFFAETALDGVIHMRG